MPYGSLTRDDISFREGDGLKVGEVGGGLNEGTNSF